MWNLNQRRVYLDGFVTQESRVIILKPSLNFRIVAGFEFVRFFGIHLNPLVIKVVLLLDLRLLMNLYLNFAIPVCAIAILRQCLSHIKLFSFLQWGHK